MKKICGEVGRNGWKAGGGGGCWGDIPLMKLKTEKGVLLCVRAHCSQLKKL